MQLKVGQLCHQNSSTFLISSMVVQNGVNSASAKSNYNQKIKGVISLAA
jgi:hypothetical protein